jgi:NAD(P)-dependent dehydrogenase (short-subunit alcohol dehydrogenase family)
MADRNTYTGKVAIVTGGASGIGAAIAKQLARAGAQVVLADRQMELSEGVAASIRASGGVAVAVKLDVRDLASMTSMVEETVARWGGVHYFFNNAGIGVGGEVDAYEARDWDDVLDVNLRGVAYGIQAVYPTMIRQRAGHIINTASMAGLIPTPGEVAYAASKYAVVGLSKSLRVEAARHNVRVSVLCPGAIRTPILTGGTYGRTNTEGVSEQKLLELWETLRPMDVDVFAAKVVAAVAKNQAIIIVPAWWKMLWYLERVSPTLSSMVASTFFARIRAELAAAGGRPRQPKSELSSTRVGASPDSKAVH